MLPSLRYSVSCALAFRPSARHIVQQLTSHRRITVASHRLEGHATQAPDSDPSVEDKVEKIDRKILDHLEKQEERFVKFLNEKQKREDVQLREFVEELVNNSKKDASRIAALVGIAWKERTAKRKLQQKLNVRGALESMAFYGTPGNRHFEGIQDRLNYLSQNLEFKRILDSEVEARELVPGQVTDCAQRLYHSLSKYVHGNEGTIILKKGDYCTNELAALVAFFKFQSTWDRTLAWREEAAEGDKCVTRDDVKKALGVEMRLGRRGDRGAVAGAEMEASTKGDM